MGLAYNLEIIPRTQSDKTKEHYSLKRRLIFHLQKEKDTILDFIIFPIYYEELPAASNFPSTKYIPDVIVVNKKIGEIWIELETDPFNVLVKLVKLMLLQSFHLTHWPNILIFGIPKKRPYSRRFLRTFDQLTKLLKIKEIRLYLLTNKIRRIR